ncbi:hypothetical protein [Thioalkalivibrio sp. XN8]|uniref:hypothetical protein n=1 Tax=Thioalkalivibrio sp. XN8 TaxID=2712863 RepID=UPI0013EC6965|nr:hypothetical protein [Thioalkalivibrio sp. XN8]NGP52506.1 hypothetical protein [Thioalkalivibrio sp. XN8]
MSTDPSDPGSPNRACARMRRRAAVLLSAAMAASLVYAFIRLRFDTNQWPIIVGFIAAVVFAAGLGFRYGAWYCEVEGERPTFELVLCPVIVFVLASLGGSAVACVLLLIEAQNLPASLQQLLLVLLFMPPLALYGFAIVVAAAWPAILVTHAIAGWMLARYSRSASRSTIGFLN